ncbi:hypothetical protein [Kitasatospora sp. NBC_00315]
MRAGDRRLLVDLTTTDHRPPTADHRRRTGRALDRFCELCRH